MIMFLIGAFLVWFFIFRSKKQPTAVDPAAPPVGRLEYVITGWWQQWLENCKVLWLLILFGFVFYGVWYLCAYQNF